MKDWELLRKISRGHTPNDVERVQVAQCSDALYQTLMMHAGKICCEECGKWRSDRNAVSLEDAGWLCAKCAKATTTGARR